MAKTIGGAPPLGADQDEPFHLVRLKPPPTYNSLLWLTIDFVHPGTPPPTADHVWAKPLETMLKSRSVKRDIRGMLRIYVVRALTFVIININKV
jgi:hypothetical protein